MQVIVVGRSHCILISVFLTSYRVIFLGTPCDPQAPNLIVTRSMPISSIYRLKKLNPTPLPPPISINTVGGLQMRSATAEVRREEHRGSTVYAWELAVLFGSRPYAHWHIVVRIALMLSVSSNIACMLYVQQFV